MQHLIKGGTIVTASEMYISDILVRDEKIALIGRDLSVGEYANIIDARGKLILPGGVDVHTHFDLPFGATVSSDDHYSGHKAAAFGGTTTVIDFVPFQEPTLLASVQRWREKADPKAAVDFSFHMNLSRLDDAVAKEIPLLLREGITSLKVFSAYNGRMRLQDDQILRILRIAKENGFLTMLHAENGDIIELMVAEALAAGHTSPEWHALTRPAWSAVEAFLRGAALSAIADAPLYVVHMNVGGEVDQLAYARSKGLKVMGETCPQYLFFTQDDLRRSDGAKWICSPPVRSREDNRRLWQGLEDGIIQVLATDHCPFFFDGTQPIQYEGKPVRIPGKELGRLDFSQTPNGLPGVGDRLPVFWTAAVTTDRITPMQFVALNSTNPAKIFGLYPQKGSILPGADADIVIWDPNLKVNYGMEWSQQRTDYNLYEGWELNGYLTQVMLRGNLIVSGKEWLGKAGMGRFIHRKPDAPFL